MNPIILLGLEIYDYTTIIVIKKNHLVQFFHFVLRNLLSRIRHLKCREQTTSKHINFYTGTSSLHYDCASHVCLSQSLGCLCANCQKCFQQKVPLKSYNKWFSFLKTTLEAENKQNTNQHSMSKRLYSLGTNAPQILDFHGPQSIKFKNVIHHKIIPEFTSNFKAASYLGHV